MTNFTPDELTQLGHTVHVWLRMLRAREKRILDRILGEFRVGRTDFLPLVTEFVVIRDQIGELDRTLEALSTKK